MKLLRRDAYLAKLHDVEGVPDIKVITGVRRSGKSQLMADFADELRTKYPDANIIYIDLTQLEFEQLKEYHTLNSYIEARYTQGVRNFLFIDEVQLCPKFELAINSLHSSGKYDIYITGSNAFLLSSDLATLFTGRSCSIEIYPFSYAEYSEFYAQNGEEKNFTDYLQEGGMPGSYFYNSEQSKLNYIADVYGTLILRDIKQKYKIRNTALIGKLSNYLMDNISNLTSAGSIAKALNQQDKVNNKTIDKYLECLCNAFAFYKIRRYDIKGKRYFTSNNKYYLSDHAFRYAKLGKKSPDYGRMIENIVAIELLRRGYELYAGALYTKEIDFVALKRDEKLYIQVSQTIEAPATFKRETASLLGIKDNNPKLLLTTLAYPDYSYEGIEVKDISNWLLEK